MLPRVLEPEVMDSREEAVDYDAMDHREVNASFVGDLLAAAAGAGLLDAAESAQCRLLDVGTGTAQIPIALAQRWPQHAGARKLQLVAVDMASAMLDVGRANIEAAGLAETIELDLADAKQLTHDDASFDAVVSNSIVHHIPQPESVLREAHRLVKPGGLLFFRDLLRPANRESLEHLVDTYAAGANAHQRKMFAESLHAALTLDEVRAILQPLGYAAECVQQTTDRHWTWRAVRPAPVAATEGHA